MNYTGIAKKNHELYNKAVEVDEKKSNKAFRLNLKKRIANFQKSWATYEQRLTKYIDKKEQHEDEGVCVACAKMADKKVCIVCSVCVPPVLPSSHTSTKKDLICDKCFQALPTTKKPKHPAQETKLKDSPIPDDKPVKTPDLESVKEHMEVKDDSSVAEDRADLNLLEPENNEEQNDMLSGKKLEQENDETMPVDNNKADGKKKKRTHRARRGKGAAAKR
jgi:hypothetical protein